MMRVHLRVQRLGLNSAVNVKVAMLHHLIPNLDDFFLSFSSQLVMMRVHLPVQGLVLNSAVNVKVVMY